MTKVALETHFDELNGFDDGDIDRLTQNKNKTEQL